MPTTEPYGTWGSDITANAIGSNPTISDVVVDPIKKVAYHLVDDPEYATSILYETPLVKGASPKQVLPDGYNARDSVNDYGGAPAIVYDGIVYFSNPTKLGPDSKPVPDNSVYAYDLNKNPPTLKQLTPDNSVLRYANFSLYPKQPHVLVAIQEDHTKGDDPKVVVYRLAIIDPTAEPTDAVYTLGYGADFYASPVFGPDGTKIAWQQWNLPNMPWEGGEIWVADLVTSDGKLSVSNPVLVAGKTQAVSATFPTWVTNTTLLYTTDQGNQFQNPYIYDTAKQASTAVVQIKQDFAEPAWWLGLYPYAVLGGGKYGAFTAFQDGKNILYVVDLNGAAQPVLIENFDYAVAQHLRPLGDNTFVFTGTGTTSPGGVFLGTITGSSGKYTATFEPLVTTGDHPEWNKYVATPQAETVPGNYDIYVIYYLPKNPDFVAPAGELPPCIINVHGGPTGLESQALNWTKRFYTSRGFAWLDVNYRGSSGYGRAYIELLNGNWGRYDNEDCRLAHEYLVGRGLFDPKRVAVRGGSAGAYTTLSSVTFADKSYYKVACAAYGCVADPTYLTKVIEKFESEYIYTLFGSKPDGGAWDNRNPILNIKAPTTWLLMLQGAADGVVPVQVVDNFVDKFKSVAPSLIEYKIYPGEGHHFTQKAHIIDALESEHDWYLKHLL